MTATEPVYKSQVWVWVLVCVLAIVLVLAVLVRVARGDSGEPQDAPVAVYIVSPSNGTFVAGPYQGAEAYVSIGSQLEPGTIVGNVEVWGKLQPVTSTVRGTVVEILVFDGAMVEARQSLLKIQIEAEVTPT